MALQGMEERTERMSPIVVKTFSETMARERAALGDKVTAWLAENPSLEIVDKVVTQSSDEAFHCLSITLFMRPR